MNTKSIHRKKHEIEHSQMLSESNTELAWGWDSPAGKIRAIRRAQLIAKQATLGYGLNVLEIGCGTGLFTEMFSQYGSSITALDVSADVLAHARLRGLSPKQVQFINEPIEEYAPDILFDAVIGSSILHHLDVEYALKRIYNLLLPGGKLSLAEPNMLNPQVYLERKLRFLPMFWYISPDEIAFVRWRLKRLMEKVGFESIIIQPFDWLHPSTPRYMINIVSKLGSVVESMPLLREFSGSLLIYGRRPLN